MSLTVNAPSPILYHAQIVYAPDFSLIANDIVAHEILKETGDHKITMSNGEVTFVNHDRYLFILIRNERFKPVEAGKTDGVVSEVK